MQLQSLSQEDPLEWEMAARSSILAWRIPRTEEPDRLQSLGPRELDTTEHLHITPNITSYITLHFSPHLLQIIFR